MSDLNERTARLSDVEQLFGLSQCCGNRLLDEDMLTRVERGFGDIIVRRCRHDDRHCIDLIEESLFVGEAAHTELACNFRSALVTTLHETRQVDGLHVPQNTDVMVS